MGLSQDEIENMKKKDQGADKAKEPDSKVIEKISTLMAESIENIIPVLISSSGEMKVKSEDPVKKQLGELLESLPPNHTYFVFSEPALTSSKLTGYIDFKMALDLSQRMMGQEGAEELNDALLSALNEAFNNVLGAYDSALKEEFGFDVEHGDLKFLAGQPGEVVPPGSGEDPSASMWHLGMSGSVDDITFKTGLIISEAGVAEMEEKHPDSKKAKEEAESSAEEMAAEASDIEEDVEELKVETRDTRVQKQKVSKVAFEDLQPGKSMGDTRGLDLILDVPLGVTVELGRKTLSIREILGLNPGSLVELEKLAGEPVDLLVNGKLFAKGEVVVIDENFGVRISSIVAHKERLESLASGN